MKILFPGVIAVAFSAAFFSPQLAIAQQLNLPGSSSSGTTQFICDSVTDECSCSGYFDCREMEKKVCDATEPFICVLGTADCTCTWNLKVSLKGPGKFLFEGTATRVFESTIVRE